MSDLPLSPFRPKDLVHRRGAPRPVLEVTEVEPDGRWVGCRWPTGKDNYQYERFRAEELVSAPGLSELLSEEPP